MTIVSIREYNKRIESVLSNSYKVVLTDEEYNYRKEYSVDWSDKKRDAGPQYIIDDNYLEKRSTNGHMGQRAVEKFLGIEFTDPDTSYDIKKNIPDLLPAGLHIGVKTHRVANPPMLDFIPDQVYEKLDPEKQKKARYPQIIVTKDNNCEKTFYILGVYAPKVLWHQDYVDKGLIYDDKLLEKGTKIPFIGVHKRVPFKNKEELVSIIGPTWTSTVR